MNSSNGSSLEDWLKTVVIFQRLSPEQLNRLIEICQRQTWQKGQVIFRQDSPATGFFVVKSGRVKVFKTSPIGKEQILNIFEEGDSFSEIVALDGQAFPASAATLDWVELIFFPRKYFLEILQDDPSISTHILISLSKHLRHLVSVIEGLSFKDVPQRLAEYLLQLTDIGAIPSSDHSRLNKTVTLDLTKAQLAAMLGTIPATLSRAFYRLSSEGLIAVNGSQITILDSEQLQTLSRAVRLEER